MEQALPQANPLWQMIFSGAVPRSTQPMMALIRSMLNGPSPPPQW